MTARRHLPAAAAALALALLAAACQQATPSADATRDDALDAVVEPTTLPTPSPAPQATAVAPPTPVSEPTTTADPTLSPTPTAAPTPTPTAVQPDPELRAARRLASLEAVACPAGAAAAKVSCWVARLPVDAYDPDPGAMVDVMVAVVDNGDPNGIGPVVYLQGGPGFGSVTRAPSFVGAAHDLVLVDQRGTGFSEPKLACPEVDLLWPRLHTDDPALRIEDEAGDVFASYEACRRRLETEGVRLDRFNTEAAAADIELLRQLLGYEQWSLWGTSYGTRLGLTIMRNHSHGVRSAVLDSVVPFEVDFFATLPSNALRAISAVDAACDVDSCQADHGDFYETFVALVERISDTPIVVPVTRPESGERFDFRVDGPELVSMVFTQLYSTTSLRSLPRQVARADFGGIEELVAGYVSRRDPERLDLATALYYTTWCREEFPFHDAGLDDTVLEGLEPAFALAVADALGSDGIERLCEIFAVPGSPPIDDLPLISDIPTLVFAGAFDPITPPAWSRQVAERLTGSVYVELADHGHGMTGSCTTAIRIEFLRGGVDEVDPSCAGQVGSPDFD